MELLFMSAMALFMYLDEPVRFPVEKVEVHVLQHDKLQRACRPLNEPLGHGQNYAYYIAGCFMVKGDVCHVYVTEPSEITPWIDEQTMAHELRHCREGYFHKGFVSS